MNISKNINNSKIKKLFQILVEDHRKKPIPPYVGEERTFILKDLPKDFIEFLDLTDGLDDIGAGSICGIEALNEINNSRREENEQYLKDLYQNRYRAEDFIIFADDGMGSYYAFLKEDGTVYYFDHDSLDSIAVYQNFTHWLEYEIQLEDMALEDRTIQCPEPTEIVIRKKKKPLDIVFYRAFRILGWVFFSIGVIGFIVIAALDKNAIKSIWGTLSILFTLLGIICVAATTHRYHSNKK